MKKIFLFVVLLSAVSLCQGNSVDIWKYAQPKAYIAYKTTKPIIIDGKADEPAWKHAKWTDDFVDIEGLQKPRPKYRTRVKMLWDDNYFYFYAELEEPNVWANITQRDAVIFHNNDFEIFIKPYTDFPQYCEFEMNALNTVWDLLLMNAYREDGPILNNWDIKGLKTAVHIDGTLNDPSDTDKGWSAEIAIPRTALNELRFKNMKPETPEIWRINFSRVEWDYQINDGKYERERDKYGKLLPEHNWVWSPQGVIDMHQPEFWGYVKFSDKQSGTDSFNVPPDDQIIQALFYLYKKEKEYMRLNGMYTNNTEELKPLKFVFNKKAYNPKIYLTNFGFEIVFEINYLQTKFVINEKGFVKKLRY
jgi:Carbohydrate family 9 binding domain-like